MPATILVVEDEPAIQALIEVNLRRAGHDARLAADAESARRMVQEELPDLVLLDWMLPGQSGLQLARRWRADARTRELPLIMLTARADEGDKVTGLDAGADDYLTKPFGMGELLARIRTALRHRLQEGGEAPLFRSGRLAVDLVKRLVTLDGQEVRLSPKEYDLLRLLVQHAGRVVTHQQLLREVWGPAQIRETQYLRVYIGQLRGKLEADPGQPRLILTEPGVGYRLRDQGDDGVATEAPSPPGS